MSKHIAIIGGTSGIGRATVAQLQSDGHTVHAACRSPEKLADLGIVAQPFDAAAPGPLTWPERLDGFVYFPGSISLKPFHRLTPEDFQRDLQVNLFGAIAALQSALPALKASGNASVVLFSTVAVAQGMPMHASIAAAKGRRRSARPEPRRRMGADHPRERHRAVADRHAARRRVAQLRPQEGSRRPSVTRCSRSAAPKTWLRSSRISSPGMPAS